MKAILYFVLTTILFVTIIWGQDKQEEMKFGIKFSGFIKTDAFFDTRQNVSLREGHFLLYPEPQLSDTLGKDINAASNFNILSIQSRITGAIAAPDAFDAKTSGILEGEFFGTSDGDVNGFRLRHAYVKLNWETSELLVGQTWHPMFIAEVFPSVVSFNTGAPFQPFSRNPQIRFTQTLGGFKLIGTLFSQRDFSNSGPGTDGSIISSSIFLRNSNLPMAHLQIRYKPDFGDHLFGVGGGFKSLVPELKTKKNYKTGETINSLSAVAFAKLKFDDITFKLNGSFAQNATDLMMIGGYAVKYVVDTAKDLKIYTNINTGSVWTDIHTNGKEFTAGIFAGYTKNFGSQDLINGKYYSRAKNIGYIYRISPRFVYYLGRMQFASELEYTLAAYGSVDDHGKVFDTKNVPNLRVLLAAILTF